MKFAFITGWKHPNPGVPYWCLFCNAYLPDNAEGQKLCRLLRKAFDGRLLFTIGRDNTVVSNGIELKTSKSGGPSRYVYLFLTICVPSADKSVSSQISPPIDDEFFPKLAVDKQRILKREVN